MTPPRAPATPLFLQALGLVGATLVAVLIATTVVIINLPPPAPEIYTVAEVAQALRTGQTASTVEGRALEVRWADAPPASDVSPGRRHAAFRLALAQVLKVSPDDVVVGQGPPRFMVFGGAPPRQPRRQPPQQASAETNIFGGFVAAA